jgi:hypothetical protein
MILSLTLVEKIAFIFVLFTKRVKLLAFFFSKEVTINHLHFDLEEIPKAVCYRFNYDDSNPKNNYVFISHIGRKFHLYGLQMVEAPR